MTQAASPVKKPTGLYFGSFNPIHVGHLVVASVIYEFGGLDQLWFVVSPHNPLKKKSSLLEGHHRLEMVYRTLKDDDRFRASDIEFRLPTPSYTIDTLAYLEDRNPNREFRLVMGSDGLRTFHKWKNSAVLAERYHRLVYPRPGTDPADYAHTPNMTLVEAPLMEISSSFIRNAIREGKDMRHLVPAPAYAYLREMHFYEK